MHVGKGREEKRKEYKLIYGRGVDVVLSQDNGNEKGGGGEAAVA